MSSLSQIEANRANAQKSTGPRTIEGKAASSMNALKYGASAASVVIPGEDPDLYLQIASDIQNTLQPVNALEQFEVDTIIRSDWQRRRLSRIENNLYRELMAEGATFDEIEIKVFRDTPTGKLARKVAAQIAALERAHSRALAELRRLRRERQEEDKKQAEAEPTAIPPDAPTQNEPNSAPKSQPQQPVSEALPRR